MNRPIAAYCGQINETTEQNNMYMYLHSIGLHCSFGSR